MIITLLALNGKIIGVIWTPGSTVNFKNVIFKPCYKLNEFSFRYNAHFFFQGAYIYI